VPMKLGFQGEVLFGRLAYSHPPLGDVNILSEGHRTITKTVILRTMLVKGHGDDSTLSFHDTQLALSS
jgi:hypothetical protein